MNVEPIIDRMLVIENDADLTPFNTFGLRARAARFARIGSVDDLRDALRKARGQRVVVLGGGSNVLLSGEIDALVLRIEIPGRAVIARRDDAVFVQFGAGESWHDAVRWTLDQGMPGLENLSLIPGTAGAAPMQNIGAYGLELHERFGWLDALEIASGSVVRFDRDGCAFGYRDSVFKTVGAGRYVILSMAVRLPRPWRPVLHYRELADELAARGLEHPTPHEVSDAVIAIRSRKLPDWRVLGNVGSFFKNPVVPADRLAQLLVRFPALVHYPQPDGSAKIAAGWLIDRAGWKGVVRGPVGVHDKQALVLVNRGGARGADVLELADVIAEDVAAKFGVRLEREPILI